MYSFEVSGNELNVTCVREPCVCDVVEMVRMFELGFHWTRYTIIQKVQSSCSMKINGSQDLNLMKCQYFTQKISDYEQERIIHNTERGDPSFPLTVICTVLNLVYKRAH